MTTVKEYNVTPIMQLIDLNSETVNFYVKFIAQSKNNEPFKALVVTQKMLDSGEEIIYKDVDSGKISGSITSNNGEHEEYFLLLKSQENCSVTVTVEKKEIEEQVLEEAPPPPKRRRPVAPVTQKALPPQIKNTARPPVLKKSKLVEKSLSLKKKKKGPNYIKYILIALAVGAIGFLVYYFFFMGKRGVAVPPTLVPPTSVPPTSVPPTLVLPTSVLPTSVLPTSVPPTSVPPTSVPSPITKVPMLTPSNSQSGNGVVLASPPVISNSSLFNKLNALSKGK